MSDEGFGDGWGDEDDDLMDGFDGAQQQQQPTPSGSDDWGEDGWGHEEEDDLLNEAAPPPPPQQLVNELQAYVDSFDFGLDVSINAILNAEYNTLEKAMELTEYYESRPALAKYTLQKELPRMDYVLFQQPQQPPITDKTVLAQYLEHAAPPLLCRSANQSLMADLLQVFTCEDGLVRPQHHAAAVAESCRWEIYDTGREPPGARARAHLQVSLPSSNGRFCIADVYVSILFVPPPNAPGAPPHVEYRLEEVQSTQPPPSDVANRQQWKEQLDQAARLLASLNPEDFQNLQQEAQVNFRDVFLQQSSTLLQSSAQGMQSAMRELEAATGLGRKLNQIPGFVPDQVLQAAEQEHHASTTTEQRPTSILGGMFRSIASKVALPQEDPSLYQEWQQQGGGVAHRPPPPPLQVSKPPPPPPPQQLKPPPPPHRVPPPPPPPPPPASAAVPRRQPTTAVVDNDEQEDGWGDEFDDLEDEAVEPEEKAPVTGPEWTKKQAPPPARKPTPSSIQAANVTATAGPPSSLGLLSSLVASSTSTSRPQLSKDFSSFVAASAAEPPKTTPKLKKPPLTPLTPASVDVIPDDWVFDPATGIVPGRKRWTNPYPGLRVLSE